MSTLQMQTSVLSGITPTLIFFCGQKDGAFSEITPPIIGIQGRLLGTLLGIFQSFFSKKNRFG